MRIGILGGTFNPPHIGHLHAATAAREELKLDRVLLLPSASPPHKELPKNSANEKQRLEMTRLAAETIQAEVCDYEIARGGVNYTADTLEWLRARFPGDDLWLIVGTDMFLSLQNWREPKRIFACAHIAVVAREEEMREQINQQKIRLEKEYQCRVDLIRTAAVEVSSTRIRETKEMTENLIPAPVLRYIQSQGLYR